MVEITGTHNTAIVYTSEIEETAKEQIISICNQPEFQGNKIRVMPDVHAGKGCTIGTTMTISEKIVPGMVGVDIGCGMETVQLAERDIDFESLDNAIRKEIPAGREIRDEHHELNNQIELSELRCSRKMRLGRARRSIGTLGGGNHFIEVDRSDDGSLFLIVHSGSRNLGSEVASYYQQEAYKTLCGNSKTQIDKVIARLRAEGREKEIQSTVQNLKAVGEHNPSIARDLAYVTGELFDDYIHDMKITQRFADLNRQAMTTVILQTLGLTEVERFTTIHNYIDMDAMILRKGAVSAKRGEKLIIPINMRDGCLICVGKGNDDWNQSAPHGAGRIMSRKKAFGNLTMDEYRKEMQGVYSTSVNEDTLDESPMAYKSIDTIIGSIEPTVEIVQRIKPVYNFKAGE